MCTLTDLGLQIPYGKEQDEYKKLLNDIKSYNRADTVNMSETEMNKFRHIAGPAYMTKQLYSPNKVYWLGIAKEAKDLFQNRGIMDTINDYENNKKGIEIGKYFKNSNMTQKGLFDYIFRTEIEPYRKY